MECVTLTILGIIFWFYFHFRKINLLKQILEQTKEIKYKIIK